MSIRVRLGAGSGIELLMSAVSVADADWRGVFERGPESYAAARAAGGSDLVRDVARFGRFGWINLAGPLTETRGAWTVDALRAWVDADGSRGAAARPDRRPPPPAAVAPRRRDHRRRGGR